MKWMVLSDLHLSAYYDKEKIKRLARLVDSFDGYAILLNGDIVDLWRDNNLVTVLKVNKIFFDALRKKKRVIWVEGNHDEHITSLTSLNNIEIVPEFSIKCHGKSFLFIHGDKFDPKIIKYYWIGKWYSYFCGVIDRLLDINSSTWFSKQFDKLIQKGQFNPSDELAIAKIIEQYSPDYDYIIVGHYHKPEVRRILVGKKPITYANSGDWVTHCSHLIIENGSVKVIT